MFDEQHYEALATRELQTRSCRSLWSAVIIQAIRDMSITIHKTTPTSSIVAIDEAHAFFKDTRRLTEVCGLAGIEPTRVQQAYYDGDLVDMFKRAGAL